MTQFHEGQEVEVEDIRFSYLERRKAKIVRDRAKSGHAAEGYEVQFPDDTRAVFSAEFIRAIPWSLDDPEIRKSLQLDGWAP